jgi:hypothetical protein
MSEKSLIRISHLPGEENFLRENPLKRLCSPLFYHPTAFPLLFKFLLTLFSFLDVQFQLPSRSSDLEVGTCKGRFSICPALLELPL